MQYVEEVADVIVTVRRQLQAVQATQQTGEVSQIHFIGH